MKTTITSLLASFMIVIATLFSSCIRDLDGGGQTLADDDMALVTLSLSVPAPPASRATEPGTLAEDKVETVDVLLFTNDADEFFRYRASGTGITDAGDDPDPVHATKTFTVRLPFGTYKVVLLANARAAINASAYKTQLVPATLYTAGTLSRVDLLNSITSNVTGTEKFPMWGAATAPLAIDISTPVPAATISLTRAVARVDVSVDPGVTTFTLTSARLYNYHDKGHVAPEATPAGYNLAPYPVAGSKQADAYISYTTSAGAFSNAIYTFESEESKPVTGNDWRGNTCLVIGGTYNDGEHAPYTTYYRVEFRQGKYPAPYTYLALTRNHLYDVVVHEVNSHGWPSAEEAYANLPSNIVVEITEWNDTGMNEIVFSEQHYLAVDKSRLDFYKEGHDKKLHVITDYPSAWRVEELPAWLTVASIAPPAVAGTRSVLTLAAGATDEARAGEFYIVAGNLRKRILVEQSAEGEFSLEIVPWEITFYRSQSFPARVSLATFPAADASLYPLTFKVMGNIDWDDILDDQSNNGNPDPAALSPATAYLDLLPAENTGGTNLGSTILVTFTDLSSSRIITRTIDVKQLSRLMEFLATTEPLYPVAAGEYTFSVMSEGPWKLSTTDTWLGLEPSEGASYRPAVAAYPYTFTLTDNSESYTPRAATVSVTGDPALPSPWTTFEIVQAGTPPYLDVISPDPPEIDFGTAADEEEVTFKTNAGQWWFEGDANYSKVIGPVAAGEETRSPSPLLPGEANAVATTTPVTSPLDESTERVLFSPSTDATLKAGPYTSNVIFHAKVDPLANEGEDTVTFHRTVPATFNFLGYSLGGGAVTVPTAAAVSLPYDGQTVRLHANTNTDWWGRLNSGTPVNRTVTAYTASSYLDVAVPGRTDANMWKTPLVSTINYGHDDQTSGSFQVTQPVRDIAVTVVSSNFYSVTVKVQASAAWNIEVKDAVNSNTLSIGTLSGPAHVNGAQQYTITLTKNAATNAAASRTLYIRPKNVARELARFTQVRSYQYVFVQVTSWVSVSGMSYTLAPAASLCPTGYTPKTHNSGNVNIYTNGQNGTPDNTYRYSCFVWRGSTASTFQTKNGQLYRDNQSSQATIEEGKFKNNTVYTLCE